MHCVINIMSEGIRVSSSIHTTHVAAEEQAGVYSKILQVMDKA